MANAGEISVVATIDTSGYKRGAQEIQSTNNQIEGSTEKSGSRMTGALKSVGKVGFAALATTAVAAMAAVAASIPSAIRRVDTLNNSARSFQNMGFESQQSAKAVSALEKSIMGLPTPLDSAMRGMTALAATYGNIETGQKVFTSLNNAILGFGGTTAMVDNALMQLSQLPMDGPLDAQTWNSLRNSGLTPVLVAMAKESGTSVSAMREAFGDGDLTVKDFTDRLVKMNTEGGGGMKSLEVIAKDSTSGIGTGFANMQTAITRGMAKVIEAIGSKNISNAIASLGKAFEVTLTAVATTITWLIINVPKAISAVVEFGQSTVTTLVSAWQSVSTFFVNLWTSITNAFNSGIATIENGFNIAKQSVSDFITAGINMLNSALSATIGWLKENRVWLTNVAIVIGTLLLPMMMKLGWEALKTAGSWVAAMARIAASAIATAARSTAAFVMMSASAVQQAFIASSAWVAGAARAAFQWVTVTLPALIATFISMSVNATTHAIIAGGAWIIQATQVAARWAITFGLYLQGLAVAAAQTFAAGTRMAAAWLLAMGPIGLVVAAAIGAAALIIANWSTVKGWMSSFWSWLSGVASGAWNGIRGTWSSAVGFFSGVVNGITSYFASLPGRISAFFSSALGQIKSIFSPSALVASGSALIDGLISGITSGFNKAKGIVEGKLEDLRGLFPFSPAKEGPFSGMGYTTHSGKALMQDFAKGMAGQSGSITSAATSAIAGARSAFSGLDGMNMNVVGGSKAFDGVQGGSTEYNIGTITIASEVDGERWLRRLSGNQEIVSNGLVPTQSYMG